MDKNTLSNYGWIIVTTIIIALMIVLATPFGNYMKDSFTGITEQFSKAANVEQGIEDGVVEDENAYNHDAPELHHKDVVPEGGLYVVGRQYYFEEGAYMPEVPQNMDAYVYGDYIYTYSVSGDTTYKSSSLEEAREKAKVQIELEEGLAFDELLNMSGMTEEEVWEWYGLTEDMYTPYRAGWNVSLNTTMGAPEDLTDKNQTTYGVILESIAGEPVEFLHATFAGCTSLTEAPVLPKGVTVIAFAFSNCTSLTGSVRIDSNNITDYDDCFYGTSQPITLTGSCSILSDIAATGSGNVTVQ